MEHNSRMQCSTKPSISSKMNQVSIPRRKYDLRCLYKLNFTNRKLFISGFLYVVFACLIILLLLLGQQFLSKVKFTTVRLPSPSSDELLCLQMRRKHGMAKRPAPVEMGTANASGVDYDWIPKELLQQNSKLEFFSV